MKKGIIGVICITIILCMAIPAFAGETLLPEVQPRDYDRFITEIPADADVETAIALENRNFKNIQSLKPIFEEDSYKAYNKAVTKMKKEATMEGIVAAIEARNALIENDTLADRILFIWDGTDMSCVDGEEFTPEDIDTSQMFGYGFEPFAIMYLLEDQSQVKGNIFAVSGGGMLVWSNGSEGYPAADVFNDLGYNYFLLQRRVGPYSEEDIYMDYNRFVKVAKYYIMENDLGGQDMYAALGWSGGGSTILGGSVNYLYGMRNASVYDSDYIPDEIDEISSDVDVEMVLYGAAQGLVVTPEENPYLPAFYICVGSEDGNGPEDSTALYEKALEYGLPAELYIVDGAPHGFGVGLPPATGTVEGTELWPYQADEFMQAHKNYQTNRSYWYLTGIPSFIEE
ncbi:MAG: hypothetical protein IJ106_05755 [Parasporobacterium sp.]|nr:hypothetical protein [Parasporobacterium sp.]